MAPTVVNLHSILSIQVGFVLKGANKSNALENSIDGRQMPSACGCCLRCSRDNLMTNIHFTIDDGFVIKAFTVIAWQAGKIHCNHHRKRILSADYATVAIARNITFIIEVPMQILLILIIMYIPNQRCAPWREWKAHLL